MFRDRLEIYDDESHKGLENEQLNCGSGAHDCRDRQDKESGAEACIQKP